jgi:hypothetical protein
MEFSPQKVADSAARRGKPDSTQDGTMFLLEMWISVISQNPFGPTRIGTSGLLVKTSGSQALRGSVDKMMFHRLLLSVDVLPGRW